MSYHMKYMKQNHIITTVCVVNSCANFLTISEAVHCPSLVGWSRLPWHLGFCRSSGLDGVWTLASWSTPAPGCDRLLLVTVGSPGHPSTILNLKNWSPECLFWMDMFCTHLDAVLWQPRFSGAFDIYCFASAKKLTKWAAAFHRGRAHVVMQCDSVQSLQRILATFAVRTKEVTWVNRELWWILYLIIWWTLETYSMFSNNYSSRLHQFLMFLDWYPMCHWYPRDSIGNWSYQVRVEGAAKDFSHPQRSRFLRCCPGR